MLTNWNLNKNLKFKKICYVVFFFPLVEVLEENLGLTRLCSWKRQKYPNSVFQKTVDLIL